MNTYQCLTPEVEAVMTDPYRDGNDLPELARKLERERDILQKELKEAKELLEDSFGYTHRVPEDLAKRVWALLSEDRTQ